MKKKKIILLSILFFMIVLYVCGFSVTFSRYTEQFISESNVGLPNIVVNYHRDSLFRISEDNKKEEIILNQTDDKIVINDITPLDTIDYKFSISNQDGEKKNEVLMKVTITFSSYLKIRKTIDSTEKEGTVSFENYYISMLEDYTGDGAGLLINSDIRFFAFDSDGNSIEKFADNGISEVDYSCNKILVEDTTTKYNHKIGFYLDLAANKSQVNTFELSFKIPGQAAIADKYIGAQYIIDLDVEAEQILALPNEN